jgi:probable F420-dependent oxidoreductase
MPMKFGITAFLTDYSIGPDELGREVEARGFDSLFVPEHTHIPSARKTPAPMGEPLPRRYSHALDPFVALTMVAAATQTLRIGTGICLVAQRDPFVLAKEVATLDLVSRGRFVFGVGFGWNREEIEHHGVPFAQRREVSAEKMRAMQQLWTKDDASFDGEYVSFEPSWSWPKPVQKPYPPTYIGGGPGDKLFAQAAAWADGWMPIGGRGIKAALPRLHAAWERAGRDPATATVIPFGSLPDAGKLEYFASLGIEEVVIGTDPGTRDEVLPVLDAHAATIASFTS